MDFSLLINTFYYIVFFAPFLLIWALWQSYLLYIRTRYITTEERVLLEVKIPKQITKSPKAMELFLEVMEQGYEGELIDKYIKGSVRGWFSLELVSLGGKIHFYFNIPKFFQNVIEARLYSQYPEVEVSLAEDYTKEVTFGQPNSAWDVKIWEYKLAKDDAYPIKTYIDYEMDRDPKEEFKIDPMTPLLEFLSSIKPTERIWIQILMMASKKRFETTKKGKKAMTDWKGLGGKLVDELSKRSVAATDMTVWTKTILTEQERNLVSSVQRNLSKIGFDVGIRSVYAASEGLKPIVGVGLNSAFKQFGSDLSNGFKPSLQTGFDNPWQDPLGLRLKKQKIKNFKYYCNRSFFYPPASRKPIGLTTEEIATIYHFPGEVATTPNLSRIPSKRGEPPENLPIQLLFMEENHPAFLLTRAQFRLVLVILGAIIICSLFIFVIFPPRDFPDGTFIHIDRGETATSIGHKLKEKRIIQSELGFKVMMKLLHGEKRIQSGFYFFREANSLPIISLRLTNLLLGTKPYKITIPEGHSNQKIANLLASKLPNFPKQEFLTKTENLEGRLFPDTYFFSDGITVDEIIFELNQNWQEQIKSLNQEPLLSGKSIDEIITMASIIERETNKAEDRRLVSGILWKRISIGMPLQVDATFEYYTKYNTYTITKAEMKKDSPYNTYTNKGLPPTPIANPGLDSIKAAINPTKSDYLYYLTGRDGKMYYASDFAGHKKNRRLYLD